MSFDRFLICQAYNQLESDYNVDGIVWERPSNRRRNESIGCQLARIGFSNPYGWVQIVPDDLGDIDEDDYEASTVREIYLTKVLEWDLPIDAEMMALMRVFFTEDYLAKFPQTAGPDYKQGRTR